MKFTFEEAELINNIATELTEPSIESVVSYLSESKLNTDDEGLIAIADTAIHKLSLVDSSILTNLPIDHNDTF